MMLSRRRADGPTISAGLVAWSMSSRPRSSRQRLTPRRRMPAPNPPWPPSASRPWMLTPLKRAGSGPEKVDAEKDLARAAALRSVASWHFSDLGNCLRHSASYRAVQNTVNLVADPVGAGYVESLARPGGNVTGFAAQEYAVGGKWMELLKEIVPHLTRVAVLRDSAIAAGPGQFGALQAVAPSFGVELRPIDLHDPSGIEHGIAAFAKGPNHGLIVTGSPSATLHRNLIITLAARHKLPAIYYERSFADAGGLISYGPDFIDQCRRAAGYVDRILKGERPADLPVQAPTKYELVINLKTAKALGLQIPDKLLALADEVIE